MKRLLFLIAALCACALPSSAQSPIPSYYTGPQQFAGVPSGGCVPYQLSEDSTTGLLYDCFNGSWNLVGSGNNFSGSINVNTDGVHAGYVSLLGQTTAPTTPSNSVALIAPPSASFTKYGLQFPATAPATATPLLSCATPSSNLSTCSWVAAGGISGLSTSTIPKATSSSAIGNSSVTDDGTTVTTTIDFQADGVVKTKGILSIFGPASISGCSNSAGAGGQSAGKFAVGTSSACTAVITLPSTFNGWTCWAYDETTVPTVAIRQTAHNASSCSLSMTVTSGDTIVWGAIAW